MTQNEKLRNTLGYYLIFISLGFGMGITGPALPSLARQTGSTLGAIGSMFLIGSLGGMLGTALSGRILDRIPQRHFVLGIAQLISTVVLAITPLTEKLWVLWLIVFINGFPVGVINNGSNTLLMWMYKEKAGPYINGLHFSFGLGAFLAPTVFAQVLKLGGTYQHAYWVLSAIAVPVTLFMMFLPNSPEHPHENGDKAQTQENLRAVLPIVIVAMLFLFFYVGSEIAFGNWIYTYALTLNLADVTAAAYLTSGFWLSFTIGRAISIPVAVRFKPVQVLTVSFVGGIGAMALAIAVPQSATVLWIAVAAVGFFMAPIWATGYNLAGQSIKLTATISSLIILGDSFGAVVLPWLTGLAIERFGAYTMPWLVLVSLALNALVFGVMLLQRRKALTALA